MIDPALIGLYVGIFAAIGSILYSIFWCKKPPQLNQVVVVIIGWTGAVVGAHLGYTALTAEEADLGILAGQRIAIVLGALAVVWTSAESFVGLLQQIRDSGANSASETE